MTLRRLRLSGMLSRKRRRSAVRHWIRRRRIFKSAARLYHTAQPDRLRMTRQLDGERLDIFQDAVQPRHRLADRLHRLIEVVVQRRIGQEAAEGTVGLAYH